MKLAKRNRWILGGCVGLVIGMTGLSFAAVPLYNLFCRVTGYGGTTQIAVARSDRVVDRVMRIRFDTSVNSSLDWEFQPLQREIALRVGENAVAFFRARNRGATPVTGTATFNVTPLKIGQYFNKIDCFCFTEQRLAAGETADMPVTFFVDPEMINDPNVEEVTTITLSYTFFAADRQEGGRRTRSADKARRPAVY